jgi:hypothetical protein
MPTTSLSTQFKTDALNGKVNVAGTSPLTYKMLLIKSGATGTYNNTLTNVGTPGSGAPSATNVGTDEASGTGYTTGGATLAGGAVTLYSTTGTATFTSPVTWSTATISAICAVVYENSTKDVVGVFDFGGTITSTAGTFTVTLPTPGASTSLVQIA